MVFTVGLQLRILALSVLDPDTLVHSGRCGSYILTVSPH